VFFFRWSLTIAQFKVLSLLLHTVPFNVAASHFFFGQQPIKLQPNKNNS
jgi:hypothetical protein